MTSKRRVLTSDDLMRMQEDGPARKRRKEELMFEEDEDSDFDLHLPTRRSDGESNEEESDHGSDEESGSGIKEHGDEDGDEESDASSDSSAEPPRPPLPVLLEGDDVSSSRISIAPRTSLPVSRKSLTAPVNHPASFAAMGISSTLLTALNKMSIRAPTDIQAACMPPLLQGE